MSSCAIAACLAFAAASTCAAQETLIFRVSGASTPARPRIHMEIDAAFPASDFAFASVYFSMEASDGVFSATQCIPLSGPCDGGGPVHDGRFVYGIAAGQLHFPPSIFADPRNPLPIIESNWRTDEFSPRDVSLQTSTSYFWVYPSSASSIAEPRIDTVIEGSAIIRVRRCYADCDGTDDLDLFDFLCFQNAFATDDYYADCDASGALDFFDFLCFQNEFAAGCG